jgi:hypothetical protein
MEEIQENGSEYSKAEFDHEKRLSKRHDIAKATWSRNATNIRNRTNRKDGVSKLLLEM